MSKSYVPPFVTTPTIVGIVADIAEVVGRYTAVAESCSALRLRRINRIRTIHGTLAIEGNTLDEAQITAILEGRRVLAPPREILEVRNAILAYEQFEHWNPVSERDLLTAHGVLMTGLVDRPGAYRRGGVGVMDGQMVIHMAPPASRVASLMADLFGWLRGCADHPLISSCAFHYDFEFIHPFDDGNGRMGRLWQSLILSRWQSMFAYLPIETLIHAQQADYCNALNDSTQAGNSTVFIEFMLGVIRDALMGLVADQATDQATDQVTDQVRSLLLVIGSQILSAKDLMTLLGLSHRPSFMASYLRPAIDGGWLEMTDSQHPRNPRQRYRLTAEGRSLARLDRNKTQGLSGE